MKKNIIKKVKFKNESENELNKFVVDYLSTDVDDMEYDFAIKKEKRNFFIYFWEKLKKNQLIIDIILVKDTIKPRSIKILLLLINIDLYFLINGLFINEDYISEVYHSNEKESFFNFFGRTNYNFFYITMIGIIIHYIIEFFFPDENKLKSLFKREKDNK